MILTSDILNGTSALSGVYELDSELHLLPDQHAEGKNCVIRCGNKAKIVMSSGSSLDNIRFAGEWHPERAPGSRTNPTPYGYAPLIALSDLETENSDAFFGTGRTCEDALICIPKNEACNTRVSNCIFEYWDGPVIYAGAQSQHESSNPILTGNCFMCCRLGIGVFGEFVRMSGNIYTQCLVGTYLYNGNSNQTGEIYKCCDVGIFYPSGSEKHNGAHNEITSVQICHCGLAGIYAKSIGPILGCQLVGCHIADAPVRMENACNVLLDGCRLDTYIRIDSGSHNSIVCCNIRNAYLYGHPLFTVPEDTQIRMNRGMGEASDEEVNR